MTDLFHIVQENFIWQTKATTKTKALLEAYYYTPTCSESQVHKLVSSSENHMHVTLLAYLLAVKSCRVEEHQHQLAPQCSPNIIRIWKWGICGLMGGAFIT